MTYKELYLKEHPECEDIDNVIRKNCPSIIKWIDGYTDLTTPQDCGYTAAGTSSCITCWNKEIPKYEAFGIAGETAKKSEKSMSDLVNNLKATAKDSAKELLGIKDSGSRREFSTGAVRDIQEGKGRCDLMPLDVVGHLMFDDPFLFQIHEFTKDGDPEHLICALQIVAKGNGYPWLSISSMLLDVAKHFEAGAKKYGEWNWQKGIPTHCYIDSAVRHFLKCACGYNDEPHDRAFVWNILCCIWTCKHKPELNDYPRKEKTDGDPEKEL